MATLKKEGGQLLFCLLFMLLHVFISPIFKDLYPFSSMPMFSMPVMEKMRAQVAKTQGNHGAGVLNERLAPYPYFIISTLDGRTLPPICFHLQDNTVFNRAPRVGVSVPQSLLDNFNLQKVSDELIERYVREGLARCHITAEVLQVDAPEGLREETPAIRVLLYQVSYDMETMRPSLAQTNEWLVSLAQGG